MDSERVIETSETVGKIAAALILAQGNMGPLVKSKTNPAFKSKYADLEAVLEVATPALLAVGILPLQAPGGDGVSVTVETMFIHAESGEWIRSSVTLKPSKPDPQGAGSAITYGRRYAMQAMCNLAAEDDDGNAASAKPKAPKTEPVAKTSTAEPPAGPTDFDLVLERALDMGIVDAEADRHEQVAALKRYAASEGLEWRVSELKAHFSPTPVTRLVGVAGDPPSATTTCVGPGGCGGPHTEAQHAKAMTMAGKRGLAGPKRYAAMTALGLPDSIKKCDSAQIGRFIDWLEAGAA